MPKNTNMSYGPGATGFASDLVPVMPSDTVDLPIAARAIRCGPTGTAGTLRITTFDGHVRSTDIVAGEVLMVGVLRVHATGTTATGLEALI